MISSRTLDRFAYWLIAATLFVPLVVTPTSFIFPFIVPKALVFRSLILCMTGAYVLLLAADWKRYRLHSTPITIAVLLFFLSFAVSTFVGVDWYRSFWDNHERMLGLFTVLHYLLFYIVIIRVAEDWKDWRRLLRIFLFAGGIVMFIGLLQKANPEMLLNRGAARVSSTLGNAIYVGGYGLFLFFMGLLLFLKEESRIWKIYAAIGGLLGFLGIFLSGTRGTVLGLGVSLGVLLVMYIFLLEKNKQTQRLRTGLICLLVAGLVGSALLGVFRQTEFVRGIPVIGRFAGLSLEKLPENTRIMAWGVAVDAWQERPVFGWGPSNYFYAFNKYFRAEFLRHGWAETWFDNAHNVVMNTLATQGIVGLATYLGLFVTALVMLFRAYGAGRIDRHLFAVSVAFLFGHFVHNLFVFENITSYLYFFFLLGMIEVLTTRDEKHEGKRHSIAAGRVVGVAVTVFVLILITNINPGRANIAVLNAIRAVTLMGQDPIALYETLSIPTPHRDDVISDYAKNTQQALHVAIQQGNLERAEELAAFYQQLLADVRAMHPLDIRLHIRQAEVALALDALSDDPTLLPFAEQVTADALAISPERQQVAYLLATVLLQQNKIEEAVRVVTKTIEHDPMVQEGWWRLALIFSQLGDHDRALAILDEAESKGVRFKNDGKQAADQIRVTATKAGLNIIELPVGASGP